MLHGVRFPPTIPLRLCLLVGSVVTDVLAISAAASAPILPSIAILLGPVAALPTLLTGIARAVLSTTLLFVDAAPAVPGLQRLSVADASGCSTMGGRWLGARAGR